MQIKNKQNFIRNFCIISHINHGKSTLADRMLENSNNNYQKKNNRVLDAMELEQERGITIKLNTACIKYQHQNQEYILNLIDTPGHVDFNYEVSRSLFACQGAILLVDAVKGIQAQTITNLKLAQKAKLQIIPAINKIDLKEVDLAKIKKSISKLLNINLNQINLISAKKNWGITELMNRIVEEIKPPSGSITNPLQALIFDAYYDQYQGITGLIFIKNGCLTNKMKIRTILKQKEYQVTNLHIKKPQLHSVNQLEAGEVGLFQAGIKKLNEITVGDTLVQSNDLTSQLLTNPQQITHTVFAHFFPSQQDNYQDLEQFLTKIQLTDVALFFQKITSSTFGNGFYCGFLGLLHLDIIQERLEREYGSEVIITTPSVVYQFELNNQETISVTNINKISDWGEVKKVLEPIAQTQILTPIKNVGPIMELIREKRGTVQKQELFDVDYLTITANIPLQEIIIDFFDQLKSYSNGFASFDYKFSHYQQDNLSKLDILVNKELVPAFSQIVHQKQSYQKGKDIVTKLKTLIPRHNFQISLQATVNGKVVARENIRALQKNVVAKCYGGDITRKKKLWKKQKEGKRKMKTFGTVKIPGRVFLQILKK